MFDVLINILIVAGIVLVIYIIWAFVWRILYLPIKMKDELIKERDDARNELNQIQAAKAVEWDKFKEVTDEVDKLRKIYFQEKETTDKLKEEIIKLKEDKERLIASNHKRKETTKSN